MAYKYEDLPQRVTQSDLGFVKHAILNTSQLCSFLFWKLSYLTD